jgi:hypothetical protein
MKPTQLLLLLSSTGLLSISATPASNIATDMVEVEITNPCDRSISCGYSRALNPTATTDNGMTVDARKSRTFSVPKGAYLKFARKNQFCNTILGKVEYKGQRFSVDCQ